MTTYYWIGGAGNWSSTAKWSLTSGGATAGVVPTATDDVIFDANSGLVAAIATVDTAQTCATLTLTPSATVGFSTIAITVSLTVTGAFSMSGTAGNKRFLIRGTTYGIATNFIVGSASALSDLDFRDLFVTGAAAPLTGTRIGDLRGVTGVTFSAAKTVYWNLAGAQNWSANGWAATSGGSPATTNFPLSQDTAVFDNTGSVTGTITMDAAIPYTGTVDMSARSSAMTLATTAFTIYGDWKNGSGTTLSGTAALTFSGRNTQSITSASKTFTQPITIDTYGGTVQLVDGLSIGANPITITNGTFTTNGQTISANSFSSSNSNVRTINLGASAITFVGANPIAFTTSTNMTFNAGTSTINCTNNGAVTINGGGLSFNNVSFTGTTAATHVMTGANTFANLTFTAPAAAGLMGCTFSANQTITGTLTCAGASAIRRIFLRSDTVGTQRTLTCGAVSGQDSDFRDIAIAGAAAPYNAGSLRVGDCGGNSGITFRAGVSRYWVINLGTAQLWSATGWSDTSGGTPNVIYFPLAQDTAVFNLASGTIGIVATDAAWNIGSVNMTGRTGANTITFSTNSVSPVVYGNWTFDTGASTTSNTGILTFGGRGTQTITSNGIAFNNPVTIDSFTGTVQLADALTLGVTRTLTLTSGTFDAVTSSVSVGLFGGNAGTLKMGSGTWTLSGTGSVWVNVATFNKGTANIVLSDTSTSARTFTGNNLSYNKLTIGGATGISTLTITGNNQFTELASTKTVAHTIDFGATTQTFGAWTVTGTVGNVVTVSGTATLTIAGARVSGVNYLALGTTVISATSPGEFYAGANSTGGTNAILTAAPTAVTRYWFGGTGTWDASTTTNWSAASAITFTAVCAGTALTTVGSPSLSVGMTVYAGSTSLGTISSGSGNSWVVTIGGTYASQTMVAATGGASVPTSADAVIFNAASCASAYTVTLTATQLRCGALTLGGATSGNATWAGAAPLAIHGNTSIAATGVVGNFNGLITLSGSATGKTFSYATGSSSNLFEVNGIGCGWTFTNLVGPLSTFTVTNGAIDTGSTSFSCGAISASNSNSRSITFGSGTISATSFTTLISTNLTFSAGTSTLSLSGTGANTLVGGLTFNNVTFTAVAGNPTLATANTFANLTFAGRTAAGINVISFGADQTITGTLTFSAGTDATMRTFVQSNVLGTPRTLTVGTFAAGSADFDFRDITIAGAAAPISGTRFGDCKGNTGVTFGAGVPKYWNLIAGGNWGGAIAWATTSGGTPAINNFPLAQDTPTFTVAGLTSGNTVTINANYNIGTVDMSLRSVSSPVALMTLATGTTLPIIYGNWINGSGCSFTGTSAITFSGRGSQTITSAGAAAFTQPFTINTPGGSVTLADAFSTSVANANAILLTAGTFDANEKNVTLSGATSGVSSSNANVRTIAFGSASSVWTIAGTTPWSASTSTNLTVTGSGTIRLTSGSAKTFSGGSIAYTNITLDQGGAGTLTISGNNTLKDITNSSGVANTINFAATTTTLSQFTAAGTAGNLLTISGTSAASPATLIYSGGGNVNTKYLTVTNVRGYSLASIWYIGTTSTNGGSLGFLFSAAPSGNFFLLF